MLAWVLVELMTSQAMGIRVKIANRTHSVGDRGDRAAAQAVVLDRDAVVVLAAPPAGRRGDRGPGFGSGPDHGGGAHQTSLLRRRTNSELTEMITITTPRITAAAAARLYWPPAIAVL